MADKANGVQRWEVDFSVGYEGSHAAAWMAKADDGDYVSYADYEQLQAKLEAAERDAARWRWVYDNDAGIFRSNDGFHVRASVRRGDDVTVYPTRPTREEAIDAAIDAQRQEGNHG